ncbi:hypothetical protein GCM10010911_36110 [Paenibacillus nasutitermitis]|uniref:Uncharacterized protein n=1 Tax=Paenibacillus nasutitermitis TaxID=1652958 RepID=A0A916Z3S5_9BACL|nr:hypothetical protein GCM10010911_36110 [Paenibacillus nasutitermitis]
MASHTVASLISTAPTEMEVARLKASAASPAIRITEAASGLVRSLISEDWCVFDSLFVEFAITDPHTPLEVVNGYS